MKTKTLLISFLFCFCFCQLTLAQDPVPEDYFDLFDPDASDDDEGQDDQPDPYKLDVIQGMLGMTGAVGDFPNNAIGGYKMVNEGCDATYVCMYNTLKKVLKIYLYEKELGPKGKKLDCSREKEILQDYALYIVSMNLDLYCIEHLHPDGNDLEDVEIINAMLAMKDIDYHYREGQLMSSFLPILESYRNIRFEANPYCSEDLTHKIRQDDEKPCGCGEYSGTLDLKKKNEVLDDIRKIIDGMNPMWQMAKAIKINERLNTLPCD